MKSFFIILFPIYYKLIPICFALKYLQRLLKMHYILLISTFFLVKLFMRFILFSERDLIIYD